MGRKRTRHAAAAQRPQREAAPPPSPHAAPASSGGWSLSLLLLHSQQELEGAGGALEEMAEEDATPCSKRPRQRGCSFAGDRPTEQPHEQQEEEEALEALCALASCPLSSAAPPPAVTGGSQLGSGGAARRLQKKRLQRLSGRPAWRSPCRNVPASSGQARPKRGAAAGSSPAWCAAARPRGSWFTAVAAAVRGAEARAVAPLSPATACGGPAPQKRLRAAA